MVTIDDVRAVALALPRTTEALVRDRVKFRVGRIVYVAFSRDETLMGFGFPKDEREALVAAEPEKFQMPRASDMRFHWVVARLDAIDVQEMRELVVDAWRMVVPKRVAAGHLDGEVLAGGMANAGAVVRIGDEVRRPSSPHTESIFALVHHARAHGFTAVPEPLGLDELGRERWEFVPGDVPVPPFPAWSQTDGLLASTAALLRRFHDAVADFVPPPGAVWNSELAHTWPGTAGTPAPSPAASHITGPRRSPVKTRLGTAGASAPSPAASHITGPRRSPVKTRLGTAGASAPSPAASHTGTRAPSPAALIISHNDVCPENVICRNSEAVAIIDFDFAAPTHRLHDLGQLAKMWIPLEDEQDAARLGRAGLDKHRRLRVVADAYALTGDEREELLDIIVDTIHRGSLFVQKRIERGEQVFIDAWNAGGGLARFERRSAWIDANRDSLLVALTRG